MSVSKTIQPYMQVDTIQKPILLQDTKSKSLAGLAEDILALLTQIPYLEQPRDIVSFKRDLMKQIQHFEHQAKFQGIPAITVLSARYILCTVIDEFILQSNWQIQTIWSQQSLLSTFHQETWGGEKIFELLEHYQADPALNIDILELIYICLGLGFQGKYRLHENGEQQLLILRMQLYRILKQYKELPEKPYLHQKEEIKQKQYRFIPSWLIILFALGILLLSFITFKAMQYHQLQDVRSLSTSLMIKPVQQGYTDENN